MLSLYLTHAAVILFCVVFPEGAVQATTDSTLAALPNPRPVPADPWPIMYKWRLEGRIGLREMKVMGALELRYLINRSFSVDAALVLNPFGGQIGIGIYPKGILLIQAIAGIVPIRYAPVEGSISQSEFIAGLRSGFLVVPDYGSYSWSFSVSYLLAIDTDYCRNCGSVNAPNQEPEIGVDLTGHLVMEAGLGFRF